MKLLWRTLAMALLLIFAALLGGAKAGLDYVLEMALRQGMIALAPDFRLSYQAAGFSPVGQLHVHGVRMQRLGWPPLEVDRLSVRQLYRFYTLPQRLPDDLFAEIRQLKVTLASSESDTSSTPPVLLRALGYADYYLSMQDLARLGYRSLSADIQLHLQFTPAQELQLTILADAQSLGHFDLIVSLTQVTEFTPAVLSRLSQLPIRNVRLRYTPGSLLQRLSAYLGQRNKLPSEELRARLAQKIRADLQSANLGLNKVSLDTLAQAVRQGTPLEVVIEPPTPLSLNALQRQPPERWMGLLNLQFQS